MDWNLKAQQASWDLAELGQETFTGFEAVRGSNGFGDRVPGGEEFSVDLKLGRVGNSVSESGSKTQPTSKRSRGSYGGAAQPASCLVDGCTADLSGCRDYHRRHKVCELHSKTPQVTIAGHKQRFCQQCSRFHALEEFDEGKRSCRKRLDGHNRRRRKPQPVPLSRYGSLLSNYQGTQLLPFSSPLVYPSTAVVNPRWACSGAIVKTEADLGLQHSMFLGPSSTTNPFPVFQGHRQSSPAEISPSLLRPFLLCDATSANDRTKLAFYDKLAAATTTTTTTQECALSLLSSPPLTSEMGLGHHNDDGDDNASFALEPMGGSVLVPNGSEVHCPGVFHHLGSEVGASAAEAHQALPSHWGQV